MLPSRSHPISDKPPLSIAIAVAVDVGVQVWGDFLTGCDNYALDTHVYQAWAWQGDFWWFAEHACEDGDAVRAMEVRSSPLFSPYLALN